MEDIPTISEGVLKKLQALLRLAKDKAATEAEAALALERAQELLLKYNLEVSQVEAEHPEDVEGIIDEYFEVTCSWANQPKEWKLELARTLGEFNFCRILYSRWGVIFVGRKTNIEAVEEMYTWVVEQLQVAAEKGLQDYKANLGRVHGHRWKNSFYFGARDIIFHRLWTQWREFRNTSGETKALVLNNSTALTEYINNKWPKLGTKDEVTQQLSQSGYEAGKVAGQKVHLGPKPKQLDEGTLLGSGK